MFFAESAISIIKQGALKSFNTIMCSVFDWISHSIQMDGEIWENWTNIIVKNQVVLSICVA